MKKSVFLALSLAIVFLLSSCDNATMTDVTINPFVGTWEHDSGQRLVFTPTEVTNYNPDGSIFWRGTYTFDDEFVTITIVEYAPEYTWGSPFVPWYRFEGETLIFGGIPFNKIST